MTMFFCYIKKQILIEPSGIFWIQLQYQFLPLVVLGFIRNILGQGGHLECGLFDWEAHLSNFRWRFWGNTLRDVETRCWFVKWVIEMMLCQTRQYKNGFVEKNGYEVLNRSQEQICMLGNQICLIRWSSAFLVWHELPSNQCMYCES